MSGCTEVILSYFFPKEKRKLKKLAEENANLRVYGGVHYPVDAEQGLCLGSQIGHVVVSVLRKQQDENQAMIDPYILGNLDAKIEPETYRHQVIPFPRNATCDSLVVPDKDIPKKINNQNKYKDSSQKVMSPF